VHDIDFSKTKDISKEEMQSLAEKISSSSGGINFLKIVAYIKKKIHICTSKSIRNEKINNH
jgi:hypothetical protein